MRVLLPQCLVAVLERIKGLEVNSLDKKTGEAPLHSMVKRERKDRVGLVLALLVHSDADIHLKTSRGATPLHLAVEVSATTCCVDRMKILKAKNQTLQLAENDSINHSTIVYKIHNYTIARKQ